MSGLFAVAIVRVVSARAAMLATKKATIAAENSAFDLAVCSVVGRLHVGIGLPRPLPSIATSMPGTQPETRTVQPSRLSPAAV